MIDFAALKAFNLCKHLNGENLRAEFLKIYAECVDTFSENSYQAFDIENRFLGTLDNLIFREENSTTLKKIVSIFLLSKKIPILRDAL